MQATMPSTSLISAVQTREFEGLFERTRKRAFNLAYRLLGNPVEAEDVTQDAYVRAWSSFSNYDRSRPFDSWLFRIVTNLVIDRSRRAKRVPMVSLDATIQSDSDGAPMSFDFADPGGTPEDAVMREVMDERLAKAVLALPEGYRRALVMADVQEMPYDEIAEKLNIAVGTVRSRIHRARNMVRKSLEKSARAA